MMSELNRAYKHFQKFFFPDCKQLEEAPVIIIAPRGRKKINGWFWANRWKEKDTTKEVPERPEILIAAEQLNRSVDDVLETLLHEMVHYKNHIDGVKDVTGAQWHNKKFKEMAEQFGLVVSKFPGRGYALTELGDLAKEAIKTLQIKEESFRVYRVDSTAQGLKKDNPYFSILLKKEDYEGCFEDLRTKMGKADASNREVLDWLIARA